MKRTIHIPIPSNFCSLQPLKISLNADAVLLYRLWPRPLIYNIVNNTAISVSRILNCEFTPDIRVYYAKEIGKYSYKYSFWSQMVLVSYARESYASIFYGDTFNFSKKNIDNKFVLFEILRILVYHWPRYSQ